MIWLEASESKRLTAKLWEVAAAKAAAETAAAEKAAADKAAAEKAATEKAAADAAGAEAARAAEAKAAQEAAAKAVPPAPHYVAPPAPSGCDPNYSGCVPIASDVDCAGGSGNGPAYVQGPVRVIGDDIYDLDGNDNDGLGCE